MMRQIKFRGKRLDNGEWIYGDLTRMNGYTFIFPDPALDGFDRYMVDPSTVGQFTGLLDNNGEDIYEGDEVRPIGIFSWIKFRVVYDTPTARFLFFRYINDDESRGMESIGLQYDYNKHVFGEFIEVIHDNELLKTE